MEKNIFTTCGPCGGLSLLLAAGSRLTSRELHCVLYAPHVNLYDRANRIP